MFSMSFLFLSTLSLNIDTSGGDYKFVCVWRGLEVTIRVWPVGSACNVLVRISP